MSSHCPESTDVPDGGGDLPDAVLEALADELFLMIDAEEALGGGIRYEPIAAMSREAAEQGSTASLDNLAQAILAVSVHDDDLAWSTTFCERFAQHPDPRIRANVMLGFGHLARRFRALDVDRVRPLILAGLTDPAPVVRVNAENAADDAEVYLKWRLRPGESISSDRVGSNGG